MMLLYPHVSFFFFNDTATTEIYTLSLHDALPISAPRTQEADDRLEGGGLPGTVGADDADDLPDPDAQGDAVEDVDLAVAADELVGGEELLAHPAARVVSGSATEVRFNDALVGLDHARRPLGDLLAVVQHEHGLAEPHDDLHVVLHEQDGPALVAEVTDGVEQVAEERPVHARGGLVEEDERRLPHQDAHEVEELLLAVREVARVLVTEPFELHEAQQLERALAGRGEVVTRDDEEVLQRRELGEDADQLEGPPDPLLGDLPGLEPVDAPAAKDHATLVATLHARDAVEERRLARAVGADQAVDPARLEPERDAVHGGDAAEALLEALDLEHGRRHQIVSYAVDREHRRRPRTKRGGVTRSRIRSFSGAGTCSAGARARRAA